MASPRKCFHADSCGGDAVVLASESEGILRKDLPLCGKCAQDYARQAAEFAVRHLPHIARAVDGPITITLRPLEAAP
jgi:hypothetical protein